MGWKSIACKANEIQLKGTLDGGQSFRWSVDTASNEWTGIFSNTVWKLLQEGDFLKYKVLGSLANNSEVSNEPPKKIKKGSRKDKGLEKNVNFESILNNYLRLDTDLTQHYEEWGAKDEVFRVAAKQFYGIRMLAQEPVENLFSFICSQNNHILRISSMIEKLCHTYGNKICDVDSVSYYGFPEVEALAKPEVERELRDMGFGYRAKFIQQSASKIIEWGNKKWLNSLVQMPYKDAKAELTKLPGVGPKVADCICLMSLQHLGAVPVDTHVFQIAAQNYLHHLRGKKTVTDKIYTEIGEHFRGLYGPLAGWAHTVLFCADLKKFQAEKGEQILEKKKKSTKKT